jgi:hypothetical protein
MILGGRNTFTMSQDAAVAIGRFFRSAWRSVARFIGGGGPVPAGGVSAPSAPRRAERGPRPVKLRRARAAAPRRKRPSPRIPDFRTRFAARRSRGEMVNTEQEIYRAGTPQDVTSIRAKSQRHRKSTADRWNQ